MNIQIIGCDFKNYISRNHLIYIYIFIIIIQLEKLYSFIIKYLIISLNIIEITYISTKSKSQVTPAACLYLMLFPIYGSYSTFSDIFYDILLYTRLMNLYII